MKTIGKYLHDARKEKKLTLGQLSDETKIKKMFLLALEKEEWNKLPEFPVVSGFVKNIASALGAEVDQASALLRRDYPPKSAPEVPKPEIPREFRVGPQLVFFLGVGVVIIGVVAYLVSRYIAFTSPPNLTLEMPQENAVVAGPELTVLGKTDPSTTVIVNSQPALVKEDGTFQTIIEITQSTTKVEVSATSRAGKQTLITRTIRPVISE